MLLTIIDNYQLPQIIAILTSSLSGVSLGLLFAWTSPAIPQLIEDDSYNITLEEASYFTIITSVSMAISSPFFSLILNVIGRRGAVLLVVVPQLLSWILVFFASNIWYFYLARFLCGVADAAVFTATPIYICEIAQPKIRDFWGNALTVAVYFGACLMNIVGAYNDVKSSAVICACFPLLHFGLFWFMPESPYYLIIKGREDAARRALTTLRGRTDVDEELSMMKRNVELQKTETGRMRDVFAIGVNRRALFICILARFAQYFSGMPAYHTYTQYLFKQAGGVLSEKMSAIIFSAGFCVCTSACVFVIDKFGKRKLMIYSAFGCGLILATLSSYFCIRQFTNLDVSGVSWLPMAGMLLYIVVSCTGINTLPTLLLGEMFSTSIKGKAVGVVNISLSIFEVVVPKLFQSLTSNFGIYAPYLLFTVCCFVSGALCYFCLIETKGKTLEEIQQALKKEKLADNEMQDTYRVKELV